MCTSLQYKNGIHINLMLVTQARSVNRFDLNPCQGRLETSVPPPHQPHPSATTPPPSPFSILSCPHPLLRWITAENALEARLWRELQFLQCLVSTHHDRYPWQIWKKIKGTLNKRDINITKPRCQKMVAPTLLTKFISQAKKTPVFPSFTGTHVEMGFHGRFGSAREPEVSMK